MKKCYLIMLSILISLVLVACAGNESSNNDQAAVQSESLDNSIVKDTARDDGKLGVITLHGYSNIFENDSPGSELFAAFYFSYWRSKAFAGLEVVDIPWDSTKRIDSQMDFIVERYLQAIDDGVCDNGCLLVTHSTGGLVSDMLLSAAYDSKGTSNDYGVIWDKTIVAMNVASATGGVNLANLLGDVAIDGIACYTVVTKEILRLLFPFIECGKPDTLGAGYDLRPSVARSINDADNTRTPHLMVVGGGDMVGGLVKPFLKGKSDGLVAMHSSCGGNQFKSYDSCVNYQGVDGGLASQSAPSGFYRNHYPFIFTMEGHGSQLMPGLMNFDLLSKKREAVVSSYGYLDAEEETVNEGFWFWASTRRNIKNSESDHLSKIIGNDFNFSGY